MALTERGRELTDRHRRAQIRQAAAAVAEALAAWRLLDLADLDASAPVWVAVQVGMLGNRHAATTSLAQRYVEEFRAVEVGRPGPIASPEFSPGAAQATLLANGPRLTKRLISLGSDPEEAFALSRRQVLGRVQMGALAGGRGTVRQSAQQNRASRGWRRVTDGNPCAFCAMLVARDITRGDFSDAGFRAHPSCGCTAEEVFGPPVLTDTEEAWVAAYEEAADQAREAGEPVVAPSGRRRRDTVLWRMRRNQPHLFHDGVHPKAP